MAIKYGRVQCGSLAALRRETGPLVRPGGASDEFIDQRTPPVGVCHHDDSFAGKGIDHDVGAESMIPTGMIEVQSISFAMHTNPQPHIRSEEHTSELQSLMRISYAVFCLKKKNKLNRKNTQ